MRPAVAVTLSIAFLTLLATPGASAGPQCIEVYPWSDLCHGDVSGFVCDMHVACLDGLQATPPVNCFEVIPWSYLCEGNVQAFVEYYVGPVLG